jgi:putative tryptophan/tyrosine transport system substrate-binding protein
MRRREFITLLGGTAAVSLASAARGQGNRIRRVAAVALTASTTLAQISALREELRKLGWTEGDNLRLDVRISDDAAALRVAAEEAVKSVPDVIFALTGPVARVVQAQTHTIPIVFEGGGDPVENGLVSNAGRPEGNITGFGNQFSTLESKWVDMLNEAAPRVTRIAILFNPDRTAGVTAMAAMEAAAVQRAMTTVRAPFRNSAEIESAIEAFAAAPNGALMLQGPIPAEFGTIGRLALKHRLPLVYQTPGEGVLVAYGTYSSDLVRGAASYVDRILRGAKPGDLPVQFPTRFRLVINLKTAKAIGLTVPEAFLLRADEIIE